MTTFQDQPPQSRRSARQSERGEQAETASFSDFHVPEQQQPPFVEPTPAAPGTGRRARAVEPEEAAAEPLNYTTQGRDPDNYEAQLPAAGYAPAPQEPGAFRVRDYSPEGSGRRAATPSFTQPQQPVYGAGASDLEYRTQAGLPAASAPEPAEPQIFTRRQLRERQAAADAAASTGPEELIAPPEPEVLTEVPVVPTASQLLAAPPPAFTTPPAATVTTPPAIVAEPPAATVTTPPPSIFDAPPPALVTSPPSFFDAPPPATMTAPPESAKSELEAPTPTDQPPAPAASDRVADPVTPTFIEPELDGEHTGWTAPIGHWSRQADLDDETQPWENTITRDVGGGNVATTTSALVLPEIPRANSFPVSLDSTGEVLLTGSIDLPQSLSAGSGDPRRYDDANVDLMFETQDAEFAGTDSSPVRAISAVSTHTSSRGVIHANKPHGNRLIVAVFVATAVLAVGVVGLLVASLFMNLF